MALGYAYDTETNGIGRHASMAVYKTDQGSVDNGAGWAYKERPRDLRAPRSTAWAT